MTLTQKTIKGYELTEEIGHGGFGAVYRAYQSTVGREVAVKLILPNLSNKPDFIRRFEGEAQVVARLEHPHITPLYDYWRDSEGAYLVMRWLRGGSLKDALKKGAMDLNAVVRLLDQIAGALSLAHRNGIIHRDIKPANILLDEDGNAYLTDFGIAKDLNLPNSNNTQTDAIIGSLDYLSPEQARSETVTPRTDIYSLGVTIYELITGHHPFENISTIERLYKHINEPLPEIIGFDADIEDGINQVIQKATAKNPENRYVDALAFSSAFREAVGFKRNSTTIEELLTQREHEILGLIIEGLSNKEIANQLTITLGTVKWYVNQIYDKLGVRSRVQAIIRARELNLIVRESNNLPSAPVATENFYPDNPYKGLRAFQTGDSQDFFGREKITTKLLKRMSETGEFARFLAVVGPSGSGKSSLVKAALIPALWRGELAGSEKWFVVEMLPGSRPLDELEIALTKIAANQAPNLREQLQRDKFGLVRVANLILPNDDSQLVLVIDQFEEVFTLLEDEAARIHFLDLLTTAVTELRTRVRVLITLRADFYDRPLHYLQFGELVRNRLETIMPLSAEELERAIRQPAERVGVTFEQGLVAAIIGDVNYQAGALPLLQYALTELFEQRQGRLLTHEAYQQIGRATGALAKRAEEIYSGLNESDKELTCQIFLRLVTLGEGTEDTRRRTLRSELLGIQEDTEAIEELLDNFAAYRLLSLDNDTSSRQPTVEIAHEALIREWERLKAWLNESRSDIQMQRQLSNLAADWGKAKENKSFLLRGSRLDNFEAWSTNSQLNLTPLEASFLQASLSERGKEIQVENERLAHEKKLEKRSSTILRAMVAVFAIASLISSGLVLFAFDSEAKAQNARSNEQSARATSDANFARAEQQRLSLLADKVMDDGASGNIGFALAMRSLQYGYSADADAAILRATEQGLAIGQITWSDAEIISVDYSPDGRLIAISGTAGTKIYDASTQEQLRFLAQDGLIESQFLPNSEFILTMDNIQRDRVYLWDVNNGEQVQTFSLSGLSINNFFPSPDGSRLIIITDATIFIFDTSDVAELELYSRQRSQNHNLFSLYYLSNGTPFFIVETPENEMYLENVETGERLCTIAEAGSTTHNGVWLEGNYLVRISDTYSANSWDIETCNLLAEFAIPNTAISIAINAQEAYFVTGDRTGKSILWNILTGQKIAQFTTLQNNIRSVAIAPDGRFLTSIAQPYVFMWDLNFRQEPHKIVTEYPATIISYFAPDGQSIFAGGLGVPLTQRNLADETLMFTYDKHALRTMDTSPDGRHAIFSIDSLSSSTIYLLDLNTGAVMRTFRGHTEMLNYIDFSSDGKRFVSGSNDGTARIWDLETGETVQILNGSGGMGAFFSPDGKMVLTTSSDTIARLWDAEAGEQLYQLQHDTRLAEGDFSPDNRLVAIASFDGLVWIWDVATGTKLYRLAHPAIVIGLDFSPDGKSLATASFDGVVRIWDIETGNLLRSLETGENVQLLSVDFSPNGDYILAGGDNPNIYLWHVDLNGVIAEFCSRDFLDLTSQQREQYGITDAQHTCNL